MATTDGNCGNVLYDVVTIFISIADIVTDVIVLISFYTHQRWTFFVLSLIILIIAQMAYAILFIYRYNPEQKCTHKFFGAVAIFFCLLPFGTIVSFLIYFTDDKDSEFSKWFGRVTGYDVNNTLHSHELNKNQSQLRKWIIKKLSRHMGFIIEAGMEALPQSLLQIIAIVYYNEANYVSIISIFLSMFSVMTKSLIFSQGIDFKTYIWTWLCIVVDFFGIFFILTWVFYTNDTLLTPDFLGYFSVIGEIWFYKVMLSVSPTVFLIATWVVMYNLPGMLKDLWFQSADLKCWQKVGFTIFLFVAGSIFMSVMCAVGFIGIEIFCFSFMALLLYFIATNRIQVIKFKVSLSLSANRVYLIQLEIECCVF